MSENNINSSEIRIVTERNIIKVVDGKEFEDIEDGKKRFTHLYVTNNAKVDINNGIDNIIFEYQHNKNEILKYKVKDIKYMCVSIFNQHIFAVSFEDMVL